MVEAELQHYKTETRPFMRLLEGVVGFTVVFSKEEKDPAQGAEFDSDTIKMVNIWSHQEMDSLYQERKKVKQVGTDQELKRLQ